MQRNNTSKVKETNRVTASYSYEFKIFQHLTATKKINTQVSNNLHISITYYNIVCSHEASPLFDAVVLSVISVEICQNGKKKSFLCFI